MKRTPFLLFYLLLTSHASFSQDDHRVTFNKYYLESLYKLNALSGSKEAISTCTADPQADYAGELEKIAGAWGRVADSLGFLFYSFSRDTLRCWLYRQEKFYFHQQPATEADLLKLETDIRASLKIDQLVASRLPQPDGLKPGESSTSAVIPLARAVDRASAVLFPPGIAENIRGLSHLLVMAELNIGRIPFYLLRPFGDDTYLVDHCSVSFAPPICNTKELKTKGSLLRGQKNRYAGSSALVVGNPDYTKVYGYHFPALPGAATEAKNVSEILGTSPLTGNQATLSKVKELAPGADLLYFATHGLFNMETALKGSFLVFTPDEQHNTGLWTALNIQYHPLDKTDLAVLSACQTGVGKVYDGGFIGIGRTFYLAGVTNTVTTLWSVSDLATEAIMTRFARNLLEPDFFYPSGHLRKAILAHRKKEDNPAHWAPFMVFGITY